MRAKRIKQDLITRHLPPILYFGLGEGRDGSSKSPNYLIKGCYTLGLILLIF